MKILQDNGIDAPALSESVDSDQLSLPGGSQDSHANLVLGMDALSVDLSQA